jgi:TnpA family transposase
MNTQSRSRYRLTILDAEEIDALYGLPRFTDDERTEYFCLSPGEQAALERFHSLPSRIFSILQMGYFKARHLFFVFDFRQVEDDCRFIQQKHFPGSHLPAFFEISKITRLKQQRLILDLCGYRYCDAKERPRLEARAREVAQVYAKPVYVFREIMRYLEENRLAVPGYSFLQDTVSRALLHEQVRLGELLRCHLHAEDRAALARLLDDGTGLYVLTGLKHEPKDFTAKEMKREIHRGELLASLYACARQVLPLLKISNESVKYYSSLVDYYSVYRIRRLDPTTARMYLLCFVHYRYQRFHDHLLNALIYHVRRFLDEAREAAKERVYAEHLQMDHDLPKAGQILKFFTDPKLPDALPFRAVRARAFAILERARLDALANHLSSRTRLDEIAFQWDHLETLARQFKRHLRPILRAVDLGASPHQAPLLQAIVFLKTAFRKRQPLDDVPPETIPVQCIPKTAKHYVYTFQSKGTGGLCVDRYEFLIYRLIRNGLESGEVFCRDSVHFRRLEDDLLSDEQWREKDQLIAQTGIKLLQQPVREQLAAHKRQFETRLPEVNRRILSGENAHFKFVDRGKPQRWTLQYLATGEWVNHPVFDGVKQADIAQVFHFVNAKCHFMKAFVHILGRYAKEPGDERAITGAVLAWGLNMGVLKMGVISDINYHALHAASENFVRLETLKAANDLVANAIAGLPIFHSYDIDGKLHSSSDGIKIETRISTINARHSPKYFGLHKGVVSANVVLNHIPVSAKIIGANEHESHHVFDLLANNTPQIQSGLHSTDTHGTNRVNFLILHMFSYQFAPRYHDICDTVRHNLYGFQHPSRYSGPIRPIRKIDEKLILEEEDNLLRIFVSLALKTTTQSIIVGKLSAYARKSKTRRALWEYDNIIKSLYLLEYIDSLTLRQNVQRALNRGENYYHLRRAVSYANSGKLRFKSEAEQQIWDECARLITNVIIYYNANILSDLVEHKKQAGDLDGAALLTRVSPVAWQHINLYGRYELRKTTEEINLNEIVQQLAKVPIERLEASASSRNAGRRRRTV